MSAQSNVIARPKPRGVNVRAFIESVERGQRPQPDFFTPTKSLVTESAGCSSVTDIGRTDKPSIAPKPLATSRKQTPSVKPRLTPEPESCRKSSADFVPAADDDDVTRSDAGCPSEDSGHSTCDLKYSGKFVTAAVR